MQVIAEVLSEYGNNIDAAIKHLNELRLGAGLVEQPGEAAQPGSAQAAEQQQLQQQRAAEGEPASPDEAAALGGEEAAGGGATGGAGVSGPKSAAEWVDTVVQQMAEASSLEDAKQRAAALLQAFEQAAVQHAKQVRVAGLSLALCGRRRPTSRGACVARAAPEAYGTDPPLLYSLTTRADSPQSHLPAAARVCRGAAASRSGCACSCRSWPRRTSCSSGQWPSRTRGCRWGGWLWRG